MTSRTGVAKRGPTAWHTEHDRLTRYLNAGYLITPYRLRIGAITERIMLSVWGHPARCLETGMDLGALEKQWGNLFRLTADNGASFHYEFIGPL